MEIENFNFNNLSPDQVPIMIGVLIGAIVFTFLWFAFFTWLIFWGTKKNNFLAIFVGVLFTGIFWGLIWVLIASLTQKNK